MTTLDALAFLKEEDKKIVKLEHMIAILGWDQDTAMPSAGSEERGEQCALLSSLIHQYSTSNEMKGAIEILSSAKLEGEDAALFKYWKKEVNNASKLPEKLVSDMALATNDAHYAWLEAREKDDWSIFQPKLERVVELTKEQANLIGDGKDLYDTLLDFYEEGMNKAKIDPLFSDLESTIHSLMDELEGVNVDDSFLFSPYEEQSLHSFCLDIMDKMGFDKERGVVGITAHPYTTTLGIDDHRISTRYSDDGVFDPIGSIVHETGHVLYEMSASKNPAIRGTTLGQGASMGIHESQSRFWENIIGRSNAFWEYQYPRLQKVIPAFENISFDSFVHAINKSKPSAIRVNADELTYNLHIILRYRVEKEIFDGSLSIKDIPQRWRDLSKSIIRYEIKNDSEGALQDVHWSQGSFGYFPTYALGNIYSAAFYKKLCSDVGGRAVVDASLRFGDYSLITSWLDTNIWSKGKLYSPEVLLESVTGSKVDLQPFKEYLVTKFSELYLR